MRTTKNDNEVGDDNRIYLENDGKMQVSGYDFFKSINQNIPINPTHDFDLLKEHREGLYEVEKAKFIEQRKIEKVKNTDYELNILYYTWLKSELGVIKIWLSDSYPNGEKKRIKNSISHQIEISKYEQYVTKQIEKINQSIAGKMDKTDDAALPVSENNYNYDGNKISGMYSFCIECGVFKNTGLHDFANCVANANFKSIYDKPGTIKSKLRFIIYVISSIMDVNWYGEATNSIGVDKKVCSGANIPDKAWKESAKNAIN